MRAKLFQSCLTLCNPMDCSLPVSSVHGILQARIPGWVAMGPKSHDVLIPNPPSFPRVPMPPLYVQVWVVFNLLTCSYSLNPCDSRSTLPPSSWPWGGGAVFVGEGGLWPNLVVATHLGDLEQVVWVS